MRKLLLAYRKLLKFLCLWDSELWIQHHIVEHSLVDYTVQVVCGNIIIPGRTADSAREMRLAPVDMEVSAITCINLRSQQMNCSRLHRGNIIQMSRWP